jgi:hypothetical protein
VVVIPETAFIALVIALWLIWYPGHGLPAPHSKLVSGVVHAIFAPAAPVVPALPLVPALPTVPALPIVPAVPGPVPP